MKRPPSSISDAKLKALLKGLREDVAAPQNFRAGVLERLRQEGLLPSAAAVSLRPVAPSSLWGRLRAGLSSAPRWGLAVGSALALALVFLMLPPAQAPLPQIVALPLSVPAAASRPRSAPSRTAPVLALSHASRHARPSAPLSQASGELASLSVEGPARSLPVRSLASVPPRSEAVQTGLGSVSGAAPSHSVAFASSAPLSGGLATQMADGYSRGVAGGGQPASAPLKAAVAPQDKPTATPLPTPQATATAQPLTHFSQVRNNVILASRGQGAQILFTVVQSGNVWVQIHDRLGRPVAVLVNGVLSAGQYNLPWNGTADAGGMAASGIYEVIIKTPTYVDRHKMMLVK
jgi:hypothetical protein